MSYMSSILHDTIYPGQQLSQHLLALWLTQKVTLYLPRWKILSYKANVFWYHRYNKGIEADLCQLIIIIIIELCVIVSKKDTLHVSSNLYTVMPTTDERFIKYNSLNSEPPPSCGAWNICCLTDVHVQFPIFHCIIYIYLFYSPAELQKEKKQNGRRNWSTINLA